MNLDDPQFIFQYTAAVEVLRVINTYLEKLPKQVQILESEYAKISDTRQREERMADLGFLMSDFFQVDLPVRETELAFQ